MAATKWLMSLMRTVGRGPSTQKSLAPLAQPKGLPSQPYKIERAWTEHFAPVVRAEGFRGSGRDFRLVTDDFAFAVNLQGSRYGGKFAVNLGVHPISIPNVAGKMIDLKSFKEIECAFRERLTEDGYDTWWTYSEDAPSKAEAAKNAAAMFHSIAMKKFNERVNFVRTASPGNIGRAGPQVLASFALIREAQGQIEEAREYATMARNAASRSWVTPASIKHLLDIPV